MNMQDSGDAPLIDLDLFDLPIPVDYYSGAHYQNLCLPDNIIVFIRRTRTYLCRKTFNSKPHHRYVLIINNGTSGSVSIDGITHRLNPGDAILVAPFQFHFYFDVDSESINWIFITFDAIEKKPLKRLAGVQMTLSSTEAELVTQVLRHYNQVLQKKSDTLKSNSTVLALAQLLTQLRKLAKTSDVPTTAHQLIEQINHELDRNLENGVGITQLAEKLNISQVHLRRKFKALTGISLGNYLVHYKLNRAIKLIVNSQISQTEIASTCGYESLSAFSRSFKSNLGVSPSEYRKTGKVVLKVE